MDPNTKLRVKNESAAKVVIEPSSGTGNEEIDPGQEKEIGFRHLRGKSFAQLMAEGKVRFIEVVNPTPDEVQLARRVIPKLLLTLGGDLVALHGRMEAGTEQLDGKRAGYNSRWSVTEATIGDGEDAAKGADHLHRAVDKLVGAKPEQKAVDDLTAAIQALENEDPAVTGRTVAEIVADIRALEPQLAAAQAALAAAQKKWVEPFADLKTKLKDAADAFAAADPAADIGQPVPPFP